MFEINLVPDVKREMLKAQKMRNMITTIAILVAIVATGLILILFAIKSGQDIAMSSQDTKIEKMSAKMAEFDGLDEFLTIQDQLGKISDISQNKQALSRVFNVLSVILNQGEDVVTVSDLSIDLSSNSIVFDGQADARVAPLIDYRVLESFKKSVELSEYDYGRYVDENGNEIPTQCILETDSSGATLMDADGKMFAYWTKGVKGCDPSKQSESEATNDGEDGELENEVDGEIDEEEVAKASTSGETVEIFRTPKFNEWYRDGKMGLDGVISGVAHFESRCVTYSGVESGEKKAIWESENNCRLAPDGVSIQDSSNGRDSSENLVLRFTAMISVDPMVFLFQNKHMVVIGPLGQNVTDSYVQVKEMFAERAHDCAEGDEACMGAGGQTGTEGGEQ